MSEETEASLPPEAEWVPPEAEVDLEPGLADRLFDTRVVAYGAALFGLAVALFKALGKPYLVAGAITIVAFGFAIAAVMAAFPPWEGTQHEETALITRGVAFGAFFALLTALMID